MRFNTFADLANGATDFISVLIPIVFLLCFLAFFWNGGRFIFGAADAKGLADKKNWLIYGVAGLLVAVTLGGLVYMLQDLVFFRGSSDNSVDINRQPYLPPTELPPAVSA